MDTSRTEQQPRGRSGWRVLGMLSAALLIVTVGFVAGILGRGLLGDLFGLPFGALDTETVDRSQPAALLAVRDLAELRAASGQYSVVLDVEEDVSFIPDSLFGERTLFVALGDVDAIVDLRALGPDAVQVSDDGTAVTVSLPPATLDDPDLDIDGSYVYDRERGLLNRIGDAITGEVPDSQPLYQQARDMVAEAAEASDLQSRAEANARDVLTSLLQSLGYDDITIEFDADPAPVDDP